MDKQLKLIINGRNSNNERTKSTSKAESLGVSLPFINFKDEHQQSLQQKLKKINGNLNMLEKKYRSNLKEGFDQKIKAYRLQAAVQRKLLKHTIEETQRNQFQEIIKEKMIENERQRELNLYRLQKSKIQQEQKQKYFRIRNIHEKQRMLTTMQEKRAQYNNSAKKSHDQVILEQSKINKKRDYFEYIKKEGLKKDQFMQKKQILGKLVENNQKLKELKDMLLDMNGPIPVMTTENTFLTI